MSEQYWYPLNGHKKQSEPIVVVFRNDIYLEGWAILFVHDKQGLQNAQKFIFMHWSNSKNQRTCCLKRLLPACLGRIYWCIENTRGQAPRSINVPSHRSTSHLILSVQFSSACSTNLIDFSVEKTGTKTSSKKHDFCSVNRQYCLLGIDVISTSFTDQYTVQALSIDNKFYF